MTFAAALLIGFLIEAALAWPAPLFRVIGHPVTWIGRAITLLELRMNDAQQSVRAQNLLGAVLVAIILTGAVLPCIWISSILPDGWGGAVIGGVLAWPFLAARSLYDHVVAVARPLGQGDTVQARHAVSMIIGRNPETLDDAGIARASLESLAENASDGIVAPVFWGLVFGLPGLVGYKAINTMDSMIGHRSARYENFGMVAARLDDLANLIPARLTGLLFALMSGRASHCVSVMLRDAGHHRSPNAGWPEAAMAGALNLRLSGPRIYGDTIANEPWVNAGAPDAHAGSVMMGLALYLRTMVALAAIITLFAIF
ncbi:adenosylcobinamide-phosphate synthase [Sulfitobacter marinus]|uniref:Cobalamin biosynthesis protein CobD n=1 Tax=Sulfitobacter marinus TaxID=394264 RepID=A0A1I6RU46_9RHOB|nr:adenosylcobinamide-phosphate synthase CbiB [Sulfitobacter marinus]SFS68245.1 adenosylcobinamide-phosphate synthase [Sulfitobacter marinus]